MIVNTLSDDLQAMLSKRDQLDLYPILASNSNNSLFETIQSLARSLQLPVFISAPLSLSLTGKVMLIDLVFSSASVLDSLRFNPFQDLFLESYLFNAINDVQSSQSQDSRKGTSSAGRLIEKQRRERVLLRLKGILRETMRLDWQSGEAYDAFEQSRIMSNRIDSRLSLLLGSSSTTPSDRIRNGLGYSFLDPYIVIIIHLNAARMLSTNLDSVISTCDVGNKSFFDLSGVFVARIKLNLSTEDGMSHFSAVFNRPIIAASSELSSRRIADESESRHRLEGLLWAGKTEQHSLSTACTAETFDHLYGDALLQSYTLLDSPTSYCQSVTSLPFKSADEFVDLMQMTRTQLRMNELIDSVFRVENRRNAKKVLTDTRIDVESLIGDGQLDSLPITFHILSSSIISLSFPSPHTAVSQSFPISFTVTASSSNYRISPTNYHAASTELDNILKSQKAMRILETGRSIPLLMRYLDRQSRLLHRVVQE